MRQRPSSAPPTSRVGSGSASPPAPGAHREDLQISVIPAAAAPGVIDQQLQQQMDHLAIAQASPGVSAEEIFYEKRAIVEQIVDKNARLRIFELAMQIEAEPHHLLQEALIMHQAGLSDEVKQLLLDYDTAGAAGLHGEECVDALSVDDIINFELPHEVKAKAKMAPQRRKYRSPSVVDITATPVADLYHPQASPPQYWSHAGLRQM